MGVYGALAGAALGVLQDQQQQAAYQGNVKENAALAKFAPWNSTAAKVSGETIPQPNAMKSILGGAMSGASGGFGSSLNPVQQNPNQMNPWNGGMPNAASTAASPSPGGYVGPDMSQYNPWSMG